MVSSVSLFYTGVRVCLTVVLTYFCLPLPDSFASEQALVLGVHPYLQKDEVLERFTPLAEYLSQQLNIPVEVRVGSSYRAHLQAIGKKDIDIAFLGPGLYVQASQAYGHMQLLSRLEANGKPSFRGHIVTAMNSPLQKLSDLRGKYFAFGEPESTMSTLVPQAMLLQQGLHLDDFIGYRHFHGHVNVALAVLSGVADAGAVKEEVFIKYRSRGLRSLAVLPRISEHVFVARADLPAALVDKIRSLMLGMKNPEIVKQLLKPIKNNATGLVEVSDEDYQMLRQMMDMLEHG